LNSVCAAGKEKRWSLVAVKKTKKQPTLQCIDKIVPYIYFGFVINYFFMQPAATTLHCGAETP
jgi:hypothetical protein